MINVQATHWADIDRKTWKSLADTIPAVVETNMNLWQHRVNRGAPTPFVPHSFLYAINAMRYARRADGVHAPVEPHEIFTFLVVADNQRQANEKVSAQLAAHGFDPFNFALGSDAAPLILT